MVTYCQSLDKPATLLYTFFNFGQQREVNDGTPNTGRGYRDSHAVPIGRGCGSGQHPYPLLLLRYRMPVLRMHGADRATGHPPTLAAPAAREETPERPAPGDRLPIHRRRRANCS